MKISAKKLADCTGHNAAIYALAPGRDERHFLTGGGDGWVVEWNLDAPETGRLVASINDRVFSLCRLPGTNRIAAGNMTGGIHWLDLDDPSRVRNVQHHSNKGVFGILPLGEQALSIGGDGVLTRWDALAGRALESLHLSSRPLRALAFCPSRSELAIGASDGSIYFVDFQSFELKQSIARAHEHSVFALAWSPDGQTLLSGGRDAMLRIWGAGSSGFALRKALPAHWYTVNDIKFSPDGRLFATASRDRAVKIWGAETFELLKVLDAARHTGHVNSVNRLLWRGAELISCSDDRSAKIWHIETP